MTTPDTLPAPLARLGSRHPLTIAAILVAGAIGVATTVATVAAFGARRWWVFDVLTSYRPQLAVIALVTAVALGGLRRPRLALMALVALGLNGWLVAPVITGNRPAPEPGSATLSIAHLNLQGHVRDGAAIRDWLRSRPADVVVLLDIGRPLAVELAADPGDYRIEYLVLEPAPVDEPPYVHAGDLVEPGVMVLTTRPDVTARMPEAEGLPRSSVELTAQVGEHPVRLLGLHTTAPTSAARHARRDAQLDAVAQWLVADRTPSVAFGDFNVTWYSPVFQSVLERGQARSSQLGFGVEATWPVQVPPAGIAIDQSISTGTLTAVARTRGPSFGSEHHSLIVTYAWAEGT